MEKWIIGIAVMVFLMWWDVRAQLGGLRQLLNRD